MLRLVRNRPWLSRLSLGVVGLVFLYVVSYAFLSSCGAYVLTQSGDLRWNTTGLSVSDMWEWRPLMVRYHRFKAIDGSRATRGNVLGRFYMPLIALDRSHWHRSRLIDPDDYGRGAPEHRGPGQ